MRQFMSLDKLLARAKTESYEYQSRPLSEGQIYMIFNRIVREDVMEGPLDMIKGAVAKGKDKLQTFGKNLTTKITADKLNKMWQGAGAPTDSQELYTLLTTKGGVSAEILDKVYKDLKIKNAGSNQAATPKAQTAYAQVKDSIPQLNTKQKKQLMAMLQTQLGTA
jgi:hypothetical protein